MMKNIILTLLLLPSLMFNNLAAAKCDSSVFTLPQQVQLTGYPNPAVLNGFGVRTKLVWDVYVASLYLPSKSHDEDQILKMDGPKRISIHFAHDVPKEKLVEGWQDGFVNNHTPEQLAKLQGRLEESYLYLRDMKEGEHIYIDSDPEKGSLLWVNGELKHSIPGDDYFQAVLQIWLGKHPAQKPLKRCLLGFEEDNIDTSR